MKKTTSIVSANNHFTTSNFCAFREEAGGYKLFAGYTAQDLVTAIVDFNAEFFVAETTLGAALLGSKILTSVVTEKVKLQKNHKRCKGCSGQGCLECKFTGITGPAIDSFTAQPATPVTKSFTYNPPADTTPIEVTWTQTASPSLLQGTFLF